MKLFQKLTKVQKLLLLMLIGFLLIGKTINLTSDDVVIQSNNFNVDKYGNMECNNAKFNGGEVVLIKNGELKAFRYYANTNKDSNYMSYVTSDIIGINKGNSHVEGGTIYNGNLPFIDVYVEGEGGTHIYHTGITTPTLTQTSLQSQKKNFEKLENALEIIKLTDIYKYNLKNENDEDKKHMGFVIGDKFNYSEEITSKNNDGVDIYGFVSVCCKAIQEQQEQIEALQKEIKELKEGLNDGLL